MSKNTVKSVERAMEILSALGQGKPQQSLSQLSQSLSLPKTTVHRLIATLEEGGFVKQDPTTRCYGLGSKILELAGALLKQIDLRTVAYPYLEELALATRQTVSLAILEGTDLVYLENFSRGAVFQQPAQIGLRLPAFCRGLGKAILAFLPDSKQQELLEKIDFIPQTPKTITDLTEYKNHLLQVRRQGYAVDNEEAAQGCKCIASPIFDFSRRAIAAVSLSGPAQDFTPEKMAQYTELVLETGRKISKAMGGGGRDN
jgi:DNA-binding IclR family transcriptional regulator